MRSLRIAALHFIIILIFFYNIERLDISAENVINIQAYIYWLLTIEIFSTLFISYIPRLGRVKGLVFWIFIYLVVKFAVMPETLLLTGAGNLYLFFVEVVFVTLIWLVSLNLVVNIQDVENTLNNLVFLGDENSVQIFQDSEELIKSEIYRSRRFEVPLSVLCFDVKDQQSGMASSKALEEIQKRLFDRYSIVFLAKKIGKHLRRSDNLLVDLDGQRLILLSLGTDTLGAQALKEKITSVSEGELGVQIKCGSATFPNEANTFEDLVLVASHESTSFVRE